MREFLQHQGIGTLPTSLTDELLGRMPEDWKVTYVDFKYAVAVL